MEIAAIILAGGKSKRMGTDKALLKLGDITLLERAINLVKSFSSEILISSNNPEHSLFSYPVIPDEIENCGPMGGILSCLKKSETEWNLVISVDSVFVERDFLFYLLSQKGDFDVVVPVSKNGVEPLIALYNKSVANKMKDMISSGDLKMQNLLKQANTKYIEVQSWENEYPKLFKNINQPHDL